LISCENGSANKTELPCPRKETRTADLIELVQITTKMDIIYIYICADKFKDE
jgi:hypothetical protein